MLTVLTYIKYAFLFQLELMTKSVRKKQIKQKTKKNLRIISGIADVVYKQGQMDRSDSIAARCPWIRRWVQITTQSLRLRWCLKVDKTNHLKIQMKRGNIQLPAQFWLMVWFFWNMQLVECLDNQCHLTLVFPTVRHCNSLNHQLPILANHDEAKKWFERK